MLSFLLIVRGGNSPVKLSIILLCNIEFKSSFSFQFHPKVILLVQQSVSPTGLEKEALLSDQHIIPDEPIFWQGFRTYIDKHIHSFINRLKQSCDIFWVIREGQRPKNHAIDAHAKRPHICCFPIKPSFISFIEHLWSHEWIGSFTPMKPFIWLFEFHRSAIISNLGTLI